MTRLVLLLALTSCAPTTPLAQGWHYCPYPHYHTPQHTGFWWPCSDVPDMRVWDT